MPNLMQRIKEAADALKAKTPLRPAIGIVLGSGLGHFAEDLEGKIAVPFADIPHFPKTSTEGHQGMFVIGSLSGLSVAALQGRYHYYEGLPLADVVFPIRVLQAIGVETIILTNACGAINAAFTPGDLMVIADHLNLVGNNPLIGPNAEELGPRFPDAGEIYTRKLREIAHKVAQLRDARRNPDVAAARGGCRRNVDGARSPRGFPHGHESTRNFLPDEHGDRNPEFQVDPRRSVGSGGKDPRSFHESRQRHHFGT
jgi:purine-nucleoside phosphorylase